jgi:hypothetical protein
MRGEAFHGRLRGCLLLWGLSNRLLLGCVSVLDDIEECHCRLALARLSIQLAFRRKLNDVKVLSRLTTLITRCYGLPVNTEPQERSMVETDPPKPDYPSPKEMQGWLDREIADITKAMDLRLKDATRFVTAYARGEISADEAAARAYEYSERWGDALPGVARSQGMSDEEILKRIDETRGKQGLLDKHVLSRRNDEPPKASR